MAIHKCMMASTALNNNTENGFLQAQIKKIQLQNVVTGASWPDNLPAKELPLSINK